MVGLVSHQVHLIGTLSSPRSPYTIVFSMTHGSVLGHRAKLPLSSSPEFVNRQVAKSVIESIGSASLILLCSLGRLSLYTSPSSRHIQRHLSFPQDSALSSLFSPSIHLPHMHSSTPPYTPSFSSSGPSLLSNGGAPTNTSSQSASVPVAPIALKKTVSSTSLAFLGGYVN